jgi:hypothetical protein
MAAPETILIFYLKWHNSRWRARPIASGARTFGVFLSDVGVERLLAPNSARIAH